MYPGTVSQDLEEQKVSLLGREGAENLLHHGEMFPVVVGLEEREAQVQLEHDTA